MATSVVTGIAAMIMTYYPELSTKQVRDIIIKSAVIRKGETVLLPQMANLMKDREIVPFANLCVGGGIISALEAVRLADQFVNHK